MLVAALRINSLALEKLCDSLIYQKSYEARSLTLDARPKSQVKRIDVAASRSMAGPVEHDCAERPRVNELIKLAIPPRIMCTCTRCTRRSARRSIRREAIKANECEESTSCDTSRARARGHEQVQKFDEPAAKLYLHRNDLRQRRVKIHALIPYRGCDSAKCHTCAQLSRGRIQIHLPCAAAAAAAVYRLQYKLAHERNLYYTQVFRYVPVAKRESERETEKEKSALRTIAAPGESISPTSTTTTTTAVAALYVHVRPDGAYILPTTYTTAFRYESSFVRAAP
uniref:Uncharacterized protein n=1 Tax=Trichogramma kaykai TaxID=54128 RepID=A0ABD2X9P6_9HYME